VWWHRRGPNGLWCCKLSHAPARKPSEYRTELLKRDACVAENSSERAKSDFRMKWDCDWKALRVGGMAKPDMATLLTNCNITKLGESANQMVAR